FSVAMRGKDSKRPADFPLSSARAILGATEEHMSQIPTGPRTGPSTVGQGAGAPPLDEAHAPDAGAATEQAPQASTAQTTPRAPSGAFSAASLQSRMHDTLPTKPLAKAAP